MEKNKIDQVIDDRVGISLEGGVFTAVKRIEETFSPARLVLVYETRVLPRVKDIDRAMENLSKELSQLADARLRAVKEEECWKPAYERAKQLIKAMPPAQAESRAADEIPLSSGPNLDGGRIVEGHK